MSSCFKITRHVLQCFTIRRFLQITWRVILQFPQVLHCKTWGHNKYQEPTHCAQTYKITRHVIWRNLRIVKHEDIMNMRTWRYSRHIYSRTQHIFNIYTNCKTWGHNTYEDTNIFELRTHENTYENMNIFQNMRTMFSCFFLF